MDKYADIPKDYDITHFPSDGRYYPMFRGEFLWRGYRNDGSMETVISPYQGFECKNIEECIDVIRSHMEWKAPQLLKGSWRK